MTSYQRWVTDIIYTMFNQLHYCVSTMASRRVLQPKNSNLSTKSWSKSCEDLDKIYEDGPACAICGDVALKSHFGVLSCEACGSFFRRYARTEDPFVCFSGGDCIVTKRTRNKCKHCRLEKCISKGMMKEGETIVLEHIFNRLILDNYTAGVILKEIIRERFQVTVMHVFYI